MVAATMNSRLRFLAALAVLGGTLILADRVFPGAGTIIAAGVLLAWLLGSGAAQYLTSAVDRVSARIT